MKVMSMIRIVGLVICFLAVFLIQPDTSSGVPPVRDDVDDVREYVVDKGEAEIFGEQSHEAQEEHYEELAQTLIDFQNNVITADDLVDITLDIGLDLAQDLEFLNSEVPLDIATVIDDIIQDDFTGPATMAADARAAWAVEARFAFDEVFTLSAQLISLLQTADTLVAPLDPASSAALQRAIRAVNDNVSWFT